MLVVDRGGQGTPCGLCDDRGGGFWFYSRKAGRPPHPGEYSRDWEGGNVSHEQKGERDRKRRKGENILSTASKA